MPRIRTIKPETDPLVAAEFRGLFFSEGHLDLVRQSALKNALYPRARIALRLDDLEVLRWVQGRFGGNLEYRAGTSRGNPSCCWSLKGVGRIAGLLDVLEGGSIPSRKRTEVRLVREALLLVSVRGRHRQAGASERLLEIRAELKDARAFRPERTEAA